MEAVPLSGVEWLIIGSILLSVICIGISKSRHGNNTGKTEASLFHITISTVVTFSSSIAMLGVPSEVWQYGFRYGMLGLCYFPCAFVVSKYFIPPLRSRMVVSSFEFLRELYTPPVTQCVVIVYLVQSLIYLSVTLYTPTLALSTVVNLPFNLILAILFFVATITTTLGGMKAVLLTDVVFGGVMFIGQISILIESFTNLPSEKLENFNVSSMFSISDSTMWNGSLYSFWDLVIGGFFMCMYLYGVNQASVHRYLSASSTKVAQTSIWLTMVALWVILAIGMLFGLILKLNFNSNELPDGVISRDQLLPFYIFTRYSDHKWVRVMFIGAMLSAALSTASSIIAVIASTTHTDLIKGTRFADWLQVNYPKISENTGRCLSLSCGLICYLMAVGIGQLGSTVIRLAMTNFGVCGGLILGVFCMGLWSKNKSSTGVLIGLLGGMVITGVLGFGAVFGIEHFKIPFLWMTCIGTMTTVCIGLVASLFWSEKENVRKYTEKELLVVPR